jgi:RNA polymerase sigma-70 factor (ECF subfamily)
MSVRELPPPELSLAPPRRDAVAPAIKGPPDALSAELPANEEDANASRLRDLIDRHYDFIWRTLRYGGVPEGAVEDGAQQVWCVLARRLQDIEPGSEMAFVFSTALRVASEARRTARRHPADATPDFDAFVASTPGPDELVDQRRARRILQDLLEALPVDLRAVFVLFEIEELTLAQVASLVGIPQGTAASRLRRARERFQSGVRRLRSGRKLAAGGSA